MADDDLPEVQFAVYPQRTCRLPQSPDGFNTHWCSLRDPHPGPCCPRTLAEAIKRRQEWERDHQGWEKMAQDPDPFADFTKIEGTV